MKYLFNSRGQHIANEVNGQLHAPAGRNIGHYLEREKIFVDMHGSYLGEILYDERLVSYRSSPYRSVHFGSMGNSGNVGNYGNPGNHGAISLPAGYEDIEPSRMG